MPIGFKTNKVYRFLKLLYVSIFQLIRIKIQKSLNFIGMKSKKVCIFTE